MHLRVATMCFTLGLVGWLAASPVAGISEPWDSFVFYVSVYGGSAVGVGLLSRGHTSLAYALAGFVMSQVVCVAYVSGMLLDAVVLGGISAVVSTPVVCGTGFLLGRGIQVFVSWLFPGRRHPGQTRTSPTLTGVTAVPRKAASDAEASAATNTGLPLG